MHEFGTAQQIVRTITRVGLMNGAKKILAVYLEIGDLTFLVPEQLRFSFEIASKGTIAEGAELIIKRVKAKQKCLNCGHISELNLNFSGDAGLMESSFKKCPKCGKLDLEIISGKELNIKNIRVEVDEDQ